MWSLPHPRCSPHYHALYPGALALIANSAVLHSSAEDSARQVCARLSILVNRSARFFFFLARPIAVARGAYRF